MLFINTRPLERAKPLTQALREQGQKVVDLPLLELIPKPYSTEIKNLYSELSTTQIIVVVSPTAVEIGMKYLQKYSSLSNLAHISWIAVGEKTAQVLAEYGFDSETPAIETSEGMLNLPIFSSLEPQSKVAFWRGEGGRQFMMDTLISKGIQVLNFILYRRQCPQQAINNIENVKVDILATAFYTMIISSEASWLNWLELIQHNSNFLDKADFWVLGERLYQILLEYKNQHNLKFKITKLTNLKTETILKQVVALQGNT